MALTLIVTNAGRAALLNAQNTGTAPMTVTQMGVTEAVIAPDVTTTALAGEVKRIATIAGTVVADDTIHVAVVDESAAAYTMRAFALYLQDGTLFAIYAQPGPILVKTAATTMLLQHDIRFIDVAATSLTFGGLEFTNPPATETAMGVAELATQAESDAGTDDLRIVTPKKLRGSLLAWLGSSFSDFWRASNDGAGSGLDADLLDGQQGSWYADILARLGFTPLNATAYTAADVRAKLITVDGAGSGVDADLLDGQQGSWFSDIAGRLGFMPLNAATYTAADIRAKLVTVDGAGSGIDADLLDGIDSSGFLRAASNFWITSTDGLGRFYFAANGTTYIGAGAGGWSFQYGSVDRVTIDNSGNLSAAGQIRSGMGATYAVLGQGGEISSNQAGGKGTLYLGNSGARYLHWDNANYHLSGANLYINGGVAWTSANDGAWSGLDADLLDGFHESAFLRVVAASLGLPGYIAFANGLKVMWGQANVGGDASATVAYPASFSSFAVAIAGGGAFGGTQQDNPPFVSSGANSTGSFTVFNAIDGTVNFRWIAIGV